MARTKSKLSRIIKTKAKAKVSKVRSTKSRIYDVLLAVGPAPDRKTLQINSPSYESDYKYAIRWAHEMFENNELRNFVVHIEGDTDLKCVPAYQFSTIGKQAWVKIGGGQLTEISQKFYNDKISEIRESMKTLELENEVSDVVLQRLEAVQISHALIDSWISGKVDDSVLERVVCDKNRLILRRIKDYYTECINDFIDAPEWQDRTKQLLIKIENILTNTKQIRKRKEEPTTTVTISTPTSANTEIKTDRSVKAIEKRLDPSDINGSKGILIFEHSANRITYIYGMLYAKGAVVAGETGAISKKIPNFEMTQVLMAMDHDKILSWFNSLPQKQLKPLHYVSKTTEILRIIK